MKASSHGDTRHPLAEAARRRAGGRARGAHSSCRCFAGQSLPE
jgi:hypothetical protein